MGRYFTPSCMRHRWKLKDIIEPNFDRRIDGKKIYVCPRCAKIKTILIPYDKIELGGYF